MTLNLIKMLTRVFVFLALLGGATGAMLAQSTTQGAIAGTVFDSTGAVIGKATVTVHNDGTNAEQVLTSDDNGGFRAPLLEPGTYTVTVAANGFQGYHATSVLVQVGVVTTLEPHMATGAATQVVDVTASAPVLNFDSPDVSTELTRETIDNVPMQNRRWSALALATPGVVSDTSGFGLVSVRGISTLLNNVLIDGADDNQAYFSEERGRTREGYSTSANAVREFQVNSGVYSAQYGRAAGGVINSVTRSGSNTMHGELQFTDLDKGFGGYVPGSVDPFGHPLKPKDLRKIYGGSVGGALIKDKLFWFYTYDQLTHIFPGISKAAVYGSPSTVGSFLEQPDVSTPTIESSCNLATGYLNTGTAGTLAHSGLDSQVCTLAAREKLATYAAGATSYNAGVSGLLTDLGVVPRKGFQEINTPKLDYQLNSKNRVSLLYHRLRWDAPGDVQTSASASYSVDAFGTDFVKLDYGVAKLVTEVTPSISNELLYQYGRELNDEGQQPYSSYTTNNLVAPAAGVIPQTNAASGTIPYINLFTSIGFNLGSPYYSYRPAYPDERKWQIADTVYYQKGNHSLRFGGDIVHNYDISNNQQYYFGDYSYGAITTYLEDLASKGKAGTCNSSTLSAATATTSGVSNYGCYSYVFQSFGATAYNVATMDYGFFAQDNWKITPRLSLELGLRYDYESLPAPGAALTTAVGSFVPYPGITNHPSDKNNIGPRVGFAYDVFGEGKTVLRGGYGIYYGRIINSTILSTYFGSGSPNGQYQTAHISPTAYTGPAGTFPYPIAGGAGSTPSSTFLAPNLQNPAVHEFDLLIQQQLSRNIVFSVTYLGAMGRTLPNFIDTNLQQPTTNVTITVSDSTGKGPLANGNSYVVPTFTTTTTKGYVNPNFTGITEVLSNVNSSYNAVTAEVQGHSIHGLQFDAHYTWAHALDFNQNAFTGISTNTWLNPYGSQRTNYGLSQFNVGNRFVGEAIYAIPGVSKDNMLKYLSNDWSIGDTFSIQNGLPYSATISSGKNSTNALTSGTWNGVDGSGVFYVPVAGLGLNSFQAPRAIMDDARLQKGFTIAEKYQLQLLADVYNIANHENIGTGDLSKSAYSLSPVNATSGTLVYTPAFRAKTAANDSGFVFTPREIQIGARLQF